MYRLLDGKQRRNDKSAARGLFRGEIKIELRLVTQPMHLPSPFPSANVLIAAYVVIAWSSLTSQAINDDKDFILAGVMVLF